VVTGQYSDVNGGEVAIDTQIKSPDVFDRAASASTMLKEIESKENACFSTILHTVLQNTDLIFITFLISFYLLSMLFF
jgi:hypothetical protein